MLLISFEASVCTVVTFCSALTSTDVEPTSLSLASKYVYPVCPVVSQVKDFYLYVRDLSHRRAVSFGWLYLLVEIITVVG